MLVRTCRWLGPVLFGFVFLLSTPVSAGEVIDRILQKHQPQCRYPQYGNPDLFYNFYVPPTCGGIGAELYPSPLPVPANVGHTYYTYQPFMPHEFLYKHHRTYHRYYNEGRGLTRTSVRWW